MSGVTLTCTQIQDTNPGGGQQILEDNFDRKSADFDRKSAELLIMSNQSASVRSTPRSLNPELLMREFTQDEQGLAKICQTFPEKKRSKGKEIERVLAYLMRLLVLGKIDISQNLHLAIYSAICDFFDNYFITAIFGLFPSLLQFLGYFGPKHA
jgi:hypothetical protein